jgi:hypothetical protein
MTTILAGKNLTATSDTLRKVDIDYVYRSIRNPRPEIVSLIRQIRIIRDLDPKQYSIIKRQLPYLVCGVFNPPYRLSANFAFIEHFFIDIDHISSKGLSVQALRLALQADQRVLLCFLSPSEDGIKLLFRLKERCYDAAVYSLFYKSFARQLSIDYHLEQVIDAKTSDVCRACFISYDPDAFFNPDANTVDINAFIDSDNPESLFQLKRKLDHEEKNSPKPPPPEHVEPDDDVMSRIRAKLNPSGRVAAKKPPVFTPQRLDEIMDSLKSFVEDTGVQLYETVNIQYGKKLRFRNGLVLAEINLFYGKRGFSVVQSPRCGTSAEFNSLMADLVKSFTANLL